MLEHIQTQKQTLVYLLIMCLRLEHILKVCPALALEGRLSLGKHLLGVDEIRLSSCRFSQNKWIEQ